VARAGVLRGRLPRHRQRRALGTRDLHAARGNRRRPHAQPALAREHSHGGRSGAPRRLRTRAGEAWGMLGLYRAPGERQFDRDELELLRATSPFLAEGARRGLLIGEARDPEGPDGPGLVVLDEGWGVESRRALARGAARRRLGRSREAASVRALCGGPCAPDGREPGRAGRGGGRESALPRGPLDRAPWGSARDGRRAARGGDRGACAPSADYAAPDGGVRIDAARAGDHPSRSLRDSTGEIADRLFVSPHTVQQHLKRIFDKTGVRSRRELVGKVFLGHYEPRLRDSERRVTESKPLRGGPFPPDAA
jgi:hypothetical protein